MICEVGMPYNEPDRAYDLLKYLKDNGWAQGRFEGIFYWEPEVGADLLPDHYILGAAVTAGENRLRFTKAMSAYADSR